MFLNENKIPVDSSPWRRHFVYRFIVIILEVGTSSDKNTGYMTCCIIRGHSLGSTGSQIITERSSAKIERATR